MDFLKAHSHYGRRMSELRAAAELLVKISCISLSLAGWLAGQKRLTVRLHLSTVRRRSRSGRRRRSSHVNKFSCGITQTLDSPI